MTDDRGAAALAERLHFTHDRGDDCNRARHEAQATAILGERGRYLPDGERDGAWCPTFERDVVIDQLETCQEGVEEALAEVKRLREALTGILLPAAWKELLDRPGGWVTLLSTEHLARARAALSPEPCPNCRESVSGVCTMHNGSFALSPEPEPEL